MTESIIPPELFPRDFHMFDMIAVQVDSNTSSMSLSLIIVSLFELK